MHGREAGCDIIARLLNKGVHSAKRTAVSKIKEMI
jgi:hypothetical protein